MKYNSEKHHRRSIRLKGYDYSQSGLYFITICVQNKHCLFGEIENGEMICNEYGKIAATEWINTESIRDNIRLHEYIIMPNHIHGIIEIVRRTDDCKGESQFAPNKNDCKGELQFAPTKTAPTTTAPTPFKSPSQTIGSIVRGYKIATIKKIKDAIKISDSKGEDSKSDGKGELQFAPTAEKTDSSSTSTRKGELQFAPTIIKSLKYKIWQRNYYEHIIRNEKSYQRISEYIITNPQKWDIDKFKI